MIEQDLITYLATITPLTALVGSRIFPNKLPPPKAGITSYPAISYFRVSGLREVDHDGDEDLKHPRFQINCWGATYASAKAVAKAVENALHCYVGTMGSATVQVCFLDDEADLLNPKLDLKGGDDVPYGVRQDYILWFSGSNT